MSDLILFDISGNKLASIADFVENDPGEQDGVRFQEWSLTIEAAAAPEVGTQYIVFDKDHNEVVAQFVCMEMKRMFQPENSVKVTGRRYFSFLPKP